MLTIATIVGVCILPTVGNVFHSWPFRSLSHRNHRDNRQSKMSKSFRENNTSSGCELYLFEIQCLVKIKKTQINTPSHTQRNRRIGGYHGNVATRLVITEATSVITIQQRPNTVSVCTHTHTHIQIKAGSWTKTQRKVPFDQMSRDYGSSWKTVFRSLRH